MSLHLKKKPKNPVIIEGFPGFGLVGTITTEFLIDKLNAELIGTIHLKEVLPVAAIHDGKVIQPIGIYHDKKTNIVILHVMTNVHGFEWEISKEVLDLAKELDATEIISIEGVGTPVETEKINVYYYTNKDQNKKRFEKHNIDKLKEGIILGVTATLLLQSNKVLVSCIFSETHTTLPDSKAAAKIIEVLDKYLGLKIDYAPLIKQAEKFEQKVQQIIEQSQMATKAQKKKVLSYVG